ncbi:MAG TPA: flavin-dependent oxidoreductase [Acidimicrobiaceae bacterium]|jgi:2-polyprenyl-6-methoxyphenol hydroxylase-like FAD-dependent oxidoreductase|nr:flavin-dependent oxidoreductase [Actinomycetota bacterium]HAN08381.1 flavin-dependent oxidoreductase [Acidimicrobiaceae bacterium]
MTVLVAGGGIAGIAMALTCHQIGVPVKVFESANQILPLGVGINLQPNAVRELYDLGLSASLNQIGIQTREWALVGRNGNDIWAEPRGLLAGYDWPQYSVHRGKLQMMMYRAALKRLGPNAIITDSRAIDYDQSKNSVTLRTINKSGAEQTHEGAILIGADGINSVVRKKMHPDEGSPIWGGAVMWRGLSQAKPIRTGASFTLVGKLEQRFVSYPISRPDPITGLSDINWIAELTYNVKTNRPGGDWNKQVPAAKFKDAFIDWDFDWQNIPDLVDSAKEIYEYPMIDRDPIDMWVDKRVGLVGDAAHAMYPVGSNGASQAIIDTRVLGAKFLEYGANNNALAAYEEQLLDPINELVLRNRGAGPIGILGIIEERCGGVFDDIDNVMPRSEIEEYMSRYKAAAGFAKDQLNGSAQTITI